jgi:hypothetical protein
MPSPAGNGSSANAMPGKSMVNASVAASIDNNGLIFLDDLNGFPSLQTVFSRTS